MQIVTLKWVKARFSATLQGYRITDDNCKTVVWPVLIEPMCDDLKRNGEASPADGRGDVRRQLFLPRELLEKWLRGTGALLQEVNIQGRHLRGIDHIAETPSVE